MPAIYHSDNNCYLQSASQTWSNCQEVVNIFGPRIKAANFIIKPSGNWAPYSIHEIRIFSKDNETTLKEFVTKKANDDFSEFRDLIPTMLARKMEVAKITMKSLRRPSKMEQQD